MRRRRLGFIAIPLLLAIGIWVATRTEEPGEKRDVMLPTVTASPSVAPDALGEAGTIPSSDPAALPPSATIAPVAPSASIAPPDAQALMEVDKVGLMIRDYRSVAGENPVGTNAEIMIAMMGKNPKEAKLGPPEGMQLNEQGELIDRWGTPYFFHQLSREHMEIRSAGADKVMWTDDDAVVR